MVELIFQFFTPFMRYIFYTSRVTYFHDLNPIGCLGDGDGKKFLFWGRSLGDFALCVKGKVDTLCGRLSFQAEIRSMRGRHSEVGKVELGHGIVDAVFGGLLWPSNFYNVLVLYHTDYFHLSGTFRAS